MQKKGFGIFGLIFTDILFLIIWIWFAAPTLSYEGQQAIAINNLVGFEAFAYSNLNLFIFLLFLLFNLVFLYIGGQQ